MGLAVALLAGACGARTGLVDSDAGSCELPSFPAHDACVSTAPGTCTFELADSAGVPHRVECDGTMCRWLTRGVEVCTCTALDPHNTCNNGVPTCAAWRTAFDWTSLAACEP